MELLKELYYKNIREYSLVLGKSLKEENKKSLFYKSMREYIVRKRFKQEIIMLYGKIMVSNYDN